MKYSAMNAHVGTQEDLNHADYIYEPKLDGYRALCYINAHLKLVSRNEIDITADYPELHFREQINAESCILDGEIIAYNAQGLPSFSLLQQGGAATYVVFDILMLNGKSLIKQPLSERKKILETVVTNGQQIEKIVFTSKGSFLWEKVRTLGLEGVMAKKSDSFYYPGLRTKIWRKIKELNTTDCVIVGYVTGKRTISSLALGLYNSADKLMYIGKVGTGFSVAVLNTLYEKMIPLHAAKKPVVNAPEINNVQWVKPLLVAEIYYLEFTSQHYLRHSVFVRLRTDKKAKECTFKDQMP